MAHLRTAGLVPAAEDASGAVLDLRPRPKRTKQSAPQHQHWREPPLPTQEQLESLIARMRSADRTGALYSHGDVPTGRRHHGGAAGGGRAAQAACGSAMSMPRAAPPTG